MPVVISFIGWHNSGKTTLAQKVVAELMRRQRRVAVVKSTKEDIFSCDRAQSDTSRYFQTGVPVILAGKGFLFLQQPAEKSSLTGLAGRFFADMELVIGEGFKNEKGIAQIEVFRGEGPQLAGQVDGVIAVVGDGEPTGRWRCFSADEYIELADFIENILLAEGQRNPA